MKLHLVSDFNLDTLGRYLANDDLWPQLDIASMPFGQVIPSLLRASGATPEDFALVWTAPEKSAPGFADALSNVPVREERIVAEVRQFADCLREAQNHFRAVFVVSWTIPSHQRGNGLLSLKGQGLRKLLLKMNLTLADELDKCQSIYLLDGQRWMEVVGKSAYNSKLWYLTKTPFHPEVFLCAVSDLKSAIRAILGAGKKLVIVDLDNTLWGGTVGDLGWENLRLGGHDHIGEAFVDFQRALKALWNRGILLAIASKNDEHLALEALTKHPEMVLRTSDFVAMRINWNDKAANIVDICAELNLGLSSVVFIDDNPVERARVREALSEVFVPNWPDDKTCYASSLWELNCFDSAYVTAEDVSRNQLYATEKQRQVLKKTVGSPEEWLLSLGTEVKVEELNTSNCARAVQLLNKTSQMNLTTRRLSEQELHSWLQADNRKFWVFRVKDKFGDSGLTGLLSLEIESGVARIVDFVLSCRVMGRNVEHAMVAFAAKYCSGMGLRELRAHYVPTTRNKPCHQFWLTSGFSCNDAQNGFNWQVAEPYAFPVGITLRELPGSSEFQEPVFAGPQLLGSQGL